MADGLPLVGTNVVLKTSAGEEITVQSGVVSVESVRDCVVGSPIQDV